VPCAGGPRPEGAFSALLILSAALLMLAGGCAGQKEEVRDPAYVEVLRLRITKVRNAIQETRGTMALSRGAPYMAELNVRLAELLSEEARYHYQLAYEREQRASRVLHVPQVRVLKEQAIATYNMVLKRFPESPLAPRILFNIGHEHRELGNFDDMKAVLQRLVNEHPESPLIYDALLVLGDYHFDRNELPESKAYYQQIAKGPLNRLSGLGHYKLAWVYLNLGECESALDDFELAITQTEEWDKQYQIEVAGGRAGQGFGVSEIDIDVRRESLVDLAYCYSRERKAKNAIPFLKKLAYNQATYVAALDKFANRYRVMDQAVGSIAASRELLRLGPANVDRLDDARTLHSALKKQKDYRTVGDDIKLIDSALTRYYTRSDLSQETRDKLVEEFEAYTRDLLTTAQGRFDKMTEEQIAKAAPQVARGYQVYLDTFPDAAGYGDMVNNMVAVLEAADMMLEAGLRGIEGARYLEEGPEKAEVLYDAVVNFQTSLEKEADRSFYERVTARAALRKAAQELLQTELEPDKARRVKFAIAQSFYDEGRYEEAIDKLSAVAYEYPMTDESTAALHLVLDSYHTINDYDGLMYTGRRLLGDGSPATDTLKAEIRPIVQAAEQRKLDELSLTAAGEDGADISVLEEFAIQNTGTDLGERALLNAFVAARAMGDSDKMYTLADEIAATYPQSDQLPGIYATIAQAAIARFEYDQAVHFLRQAADVNPDRKVQLLIAAGGLLDQLADFSGAQTLYAEAIRSAEGASRAEALAAMASLLEREGNPSATITQLGSYSADGDSELFARLGLAYVSTGQLDQAENFLQKALVGDAGVSPDAQARAEYGMAEVLLVTLQGYPEPDDLDLLSEFITLIEVVEEGYLNAARQGNAAFASAALSRLSFAASMSANRLKTIRLPGGLTADEQKAVQAAIDGRVQGLEATAQQAIEACAQQAWTNMLLNPIVRDCMNGQVMQSASVQWDILTPRNVASAPAGLDELRQQLSKNPEDIEGLRQLGNKFLDANDPHAARLVFARAVATGGGPVEQNLLGIASYRAGDITGAFEGFSMAASGGEEAGRQNMVTLLKEQGLGAAADVALERYQEGTAGGRLLSQ